MFCWLPGEHMGILIKLLVDLIEKNKGGLSQVSKITIGIPEYFKIVKNKDTFLLFWHQKSEGMKNALFFHCDIHLFFTLSNDFFK